MEICQDLKVMVTFSLQNCAREQPSYFEIVCFMVQCARKSAFFFHLQQNPLAPTSKFLAFPLYLYINNIKTNTKEGTFLAPTFQFQFLSYMYLKPIQIQEDIYTKVLSHNCIWNGSLYNFARSKTFTIAPTCDILPPQETKGK